MAEPHIARQSRSMLGWRAVLLTADKARPKTALAWWSWLQFLVGGLGLLIAGQWHPWGWLFGGTVIEAFYAVFAWRTHQPGFYASAAFYSVVSLYNFWTNFAH